MKKEGFIKSKGKFAFLVAICSSTLFSNVTVAGNTFVVRKYDYSNITWLSSKWWLYVLLLALFLITLIYSKLKISNSKKIRRGNKLLPIDSFNSTFFSMGNGIIVTDENGIVTYLNPSAEDITGHCKQDTNNKHITDVLKLYDINNNSIELKRNIIFEDGSTFDAVIASKNGISCTTSITTNKIYDDKSRQLGYIVLIQNINNCKKSDLVLRRNEEKYRSLYQQSEYPMILIENGTITDCNSKATDIFKCEQCSIVNQKFIDLTAVNQSFKELIESQFNERISLALRGTPQYFEWFLKCSDGSSAPVEISLRKIILDGYDAFQATIYDSINKNHTISNQLTKTNYDQLTDLPNRKLFYDYLNIAIADAETIGKKLSVLFIDLDLFKNINDTLGHDIGDKLLQQAAARLLQVTNKDTDIVARMGGDEFAILLTKFKDEAEVHCLSQNILKLFSNPFLIENQELYISVSIGIAIYPGHGNDTHSVLKNAASSMYKAKNMGRNNYQAYTPDINENTLQKFKMQKSLRYALEKNELLLHYQPKVDGKTGNLVGMEALVRWQHPERGLIYPAEFIPLAEETGFIKQIDEWVLKTACTQLKKWTSMGHTSLRLAVNLSAWQFKEQHLAEIVAEVLKQTGVNPSELELEITETAAMENLSFTVNTLGKLMSMGVNISIDDFGTGYSSLNYLKHFPINFLKIDRSFVSDIIDDKNTCAIVKAIIDVAHTLNLKVIAEGVETEGQLSMLQGMGCDEIQGYYISKPLPVDELESRMTI